MELLVLKVCDICGKEFDGHGLAKRCSKECKREYQKRYRETPERKQYMAKYAKRPEVVAKRKEYYNYRSKTDAYRKYKREYVKQYRERDYVQKREKEYYQRPEVKERGRKANQTPERKEYMLRYYKTPQYKEYCKRKLERNPELTKHNRWNYGFLKRLEAWESTGYNYKDHETHHIIPLKFNPNFGLDDWNGVVLPQKWHKEFHNKTNIRDFCLDWPGLLFDFIEEKIRESNRGLVTLDQWISIEA